MNNLNSDESKETSRIFEHLSIFVITYNRCVELLATLKQLRDSPWAKCKITVLDNCSTDDTMEVVRNIQQIFPALTYIRNDINIGPAANAIQPFLMSQTPYTWILCDDDELDFSQVADIEEALTSRRPRLAMVGGHPETHRRGAEGFATPQMLLDSGVNYYRDNSFLPSTIYETDFARQHVCDCYRFCYFNYPHVAIGLAAVMESQLVYVSKNSLVTPSIGTQSYSSRDQLLWWYELSQSIKDKKERKRFLTSQWKGPLDPSGLYGLLNTAIRLKHYRIALQLVRIFNFQVPVSIATMAISRLKGIRHST